MEDIAPISGYLTFADGVRSKEIILRSLQDIEEEANEVFSIKLISAKNGARVADVDNAGTLTGQYTSQFVLTMLPGLTFYCCSE